MKRNMVDMMKFFIFFMYHFTCLNLGWAQTSAPTPRPNQTTPITATPRPALPSQPVDPSGLSGAFPGVVSGLGTSNSPSSGDSSGGSSSTAMDALLNLVGSVNAGKGKYEEYQSICRENLYDSPAYFDADTQQKRIETLKEKIKSEKSASAEKVKLLKEYIDQGKHLDAEQQYASIKAERTNEQLGKVAEGLHQLTQGQTNKAESTLSKLAIEDPKNVLVLTYLAEIYTKNQKYFEAASAYFDLVKLTKTSFDLELCKIHTLDSQHNEAEKTCKKANQLLETNPYPLLYLGISQREKLNYDEAIKTIKESLRIRQTEMGFSCLGEIYFIKEKFSDAAELFKRALKIFPGSSRAMLGKAWAQFKDKKTLEALESFKQACSIDRNIKTDLRRAYKILTDEKSIHARAFAEQAQRCTE